MNRALWITVTIAALFLGGLYLWSYLGNRATISQTDKIHRALDQAEKDMGIYDPDSVRTIPVTKRAQKMSDALTQRAKEHRRVLDSLTRAEREDLGDPTLSDTSMPK